MESKIKSINFNEIVTFSEPTIFTGKEKFDQWFSADGGIVVGSAVYVSGTSGAGKTTLMVNLMNWLEDYKSSAYFREMEDRHVKLQTKNLEFNHKNAFVCDAKSCATFDDYMNELDLLKPKVVIIDSLQVIAKEDYALKGIMSEDAACYEIIKRLRDWISENNAILFLIGHNTKEGDFAGKNTIIQMIDSHIVMTFEKKNNSRTIEWGTKNRKGPMGSLYYTFEKTGIDFHTTEEWESRTQNKNFRESFITFATSYVSTINTKNESGEKFVNEYNKALKKINKSDDGDKICSELLNLLMELSDKFEE